MLVLKKRSEFGTACYHSPPKTTVSKEIVPFSQMSNLCRHNIFTTLMILIFHHTLWSRQWHSIKKQNKTLHTGLCCCLLKMPGDPDFAQGVNKALKNVSKCCQVRLCCCPLQVPVDKKFLQGINKVLRKKYEQKQNKQKNTVM